MLRQNTSLLFTRSSSRKFSHCPRKTECKEQSQLVPLTVKFWPIPCGQMNLGTAPRRRLRFSWRNCLQRQRRTSADPRLSFPSKYHDRACISSATCSHSQASYFQHSRRDSTSDFLFQFNWTRSSSGEEVLVLWEAAMVPRSFRQRWLMRNYGKGYRC